MNEEQIRETTKVEKVIGFFVLLGFACAILMAGFFLYEIISTAMTKDGSRGIICPSEYDILPIIFAVLFLITVLIVSYLAWKLFPKNENAGFLRFIALSCGITFLLYGIFSIFLIMKFSIFNNNRYPDAFAGDPYLVLPLTSILNLIMCGYFLIRFNFTRNIFHAFLFAFFSISMLSILYYYLEKYVFEYYIMYDMIYLRFLTLPEDQIYIRYFLIALILCLTVSLIRFLPQKNSPFIRIILLVLLKNPLTSYPPLS